MSEENMEVGSEMSEENMEEGDSEMSEQNIKIKSKYIPLISSYFAAYTNDESYLDSLVKIHRFMHGPTPMNAEPERPSRAASAPVARPNRPLDLGTPPNKGNEPMGEPEEPINSGPAASASIDTTLPGVSVLGPPNSTEVTSRRPPLLIGTKRQIGTPNGERVFKRAASLPTTLMEVEE